jgi:peptide/nickel transport system substrate-binding protein
MKRWCSALTSGLLAATLLAACTRGGRYVEPHVLTIADGTGDVPTLNPHLFAETTLGYIAELTQAYLVKYDARNQPYPELATEVPTQANGGISKDGKTITFHLRRGVRWSDGAPFTADDVVFSTRVVLNPKNNEIGRDGWNLITGVEEPDKYTVVFHLRRPYSSYEPTFFGSSGGNPSILPEHLLARYPTINDIPYNSKPVGIGPFRVVDWKRGDRIDLEANPYYFRGTPRLKRIVYKLVPSTDTVLTMLQTGDVDIYPEVPPYYIPRLLTISKIDTIVQPSPFYTHIDFNVTRPLVSDLRVRRAILYAIDRKTIVQKIVHGYGIVQDSTISPAIPGAPADVPTTPYDPSAARKLLDDAGWRAGPGGIREKDGKKLSLLLVYGAGASVLNDMVELIRGDLKRVGIQLQTRTYAPAMLFALYQDNGILNRGKWDMALFSWQGLNPPDISPLWECNQIPPNGQNVTRFCNARLDRLLEAYKRTYDPVRQERILAEEAKIIQENVPTIVLYVWKQGMAYNKAVTGWNPPVWTPFDQMMNVDIR